LPSRYITYITYIMMSIPIAVYFYISYIIDMAKETAFPVRKLLLLSEETAKRISELRFDRRVQSEAEMIRQIIEAGLKSLEKGVKEPANG
jgi:hypothetical protein